jgi:hypothetical protein
MRLTRESLIKVAREAAEQRARISRRIICIYLTGSILSDAPLLGGTTDIDLFVIHDSDPVQAREVVRLSDEVSLDISHYAQSVFHQPRHLRTDPWLGPFLYRKPLVLHDTQHWFDFAQAATGAQFFQPDYVIQRAGRLARTARQDWMHLENNRDERHPRRVYRYLKILENAGNALVSLTGESEPLTERRFFLQLPHRIQQLQRPELVSGLAELYTTEITTMESAWTEWLKAWKETYRAAGRLDNIPPRIHPSREMYYEQAAVATWSENPNAALWPLLRTWSLAASFLPEEMPELAGWRSAMEILHLDETSFTDRVASLDGYLDRVEETLEYWARSNGVNVPTEL